MHNEQPNGCLEYKDDFQEGCLVCILLDFYKNMPIINPLSWFMITSVFQAPYATNIVTTFYLNKVYVVGQILSRKYSRIFNFHTTC